MDKINIDDLHSIFLGIENNKEVYFNKLYEKYKKLVYSVAFSILKNKENSEDVVQKVFIKIWNMENQKLPKSNEACWLYSITKNEAIDLIRTQKSLLNIDELYYISEENEELNKILDKDSYNRIISKLDLKEQEIISLKILSNLSFKEISHILDIPESTAKWKYYKSLHTLKLLLGNLGMFIISFTIGLKTLFSNPFQPPQMENTVQENIVQENIIIPDTSQSSSEHQKTETQEGEDYLEQNITNSVQENTTQQVIIQVPSTTNNYFEIGFLGVSALFLIFTIYFIIIFIKHQLNRKHKSSK